MSPVIQPKRVFTKPSELLRFQLEKLDAVASRASQLFQFARKELGDAALTEQVLLRAIELAEKEEQ